MALPIDHSVPDTAPGAATNVFGAAGAELVVSEAGANPAGAVPAGIVVAAAGDGLKADLTVLGLADLLRLRLNEDGPTGRQGVQAEDGAAGRPSGLTIGLTQLRGIADLPADLTDLDLEQVLGLDLTGNILPTVLEVAKLPADLTGLELAQVLGLKLAGAAVPTIQEVIQLALQSFDANADNSDTNDSDSSDTDNTEADNSDAAADGPLSSAHFDNGGDLSFIGDQSLTEQAELNSAEAAKAASQGHANGKAFAAGADLPGVRAGQKDTFDEEDFENNGQGSGESTGGEGGGGGGGGTNVINGTNGDDMLNGTAGVDLINGQNGNDTLDGGPGADKLHGQNGDDILVWDATDTQIFGGNGTDTLRVDVVSADITAFGGNIQNIEIVDLATDVGANALTVSYADVLSMTDNSDTLTIDGDALDSIDAGTGWTDGGVSGGYHIYTQGSGGNAATLQVDTDITVNANVLV